MMSGPSQAPSSSSRCWAWGTAADHRLEVLIDGEQVAVLVDELLHGVADMYLAGKDDKTLQRTIPHWLFLMFEREPGEEPVGISQQQTVDTQVAANGHQPVVLALIRIREPKVIIELKNHNLMSNE